MEEQKVTLMKWAEIKFDSAERRCHLQEQLAPLGGTNRPGLVRCVRVLSSSPGGESGSQIKASLQYWNHLDELARSAELRATSLQRSPRCWSWKRAGLRDEPRSGGSGR